MTPLERLLGTTASEPVDKLADRLVAADQAFIQDLIKARRAAQMTQKDVARVLGIEQSSVASFERMGNDPRLSTIRRYALAVRAEVEHHVVRAADCELPHEAKVDPRRVSDIEVKLAGKLHRSDAHGTARESVKDLVGLAGTFASTWSSKPRQRKQSA